MKTFPGTFRNRIVGQGDVPPEQLLANPDNWRIHPRSQQEQVQAVLETVGWVQRVIVNKRTGHVVDGHLRVELAISKEEETVPVTYIDVPHEEEKLLLATLDPLAALAGRDNEKLSALVDDVSPLAPDEVDLTAILRTDRKPSKGLTHNVNECRCCQNGCQPGCGCWREPEGDTDDA